MGSEADKEVGNKEVKRWATRIIKRWATRRIKRWAAIIVQRWATRRYKEVGNDEERCGQRGGKAVGRKEDKEMGICKARVGHHGG